MKLKKVVALLLAVVMLSMSFATISYASDGSGEEEQSFELTFTSDSGIAPRINSDGSFTYYFSTRLHSDTFTATSDKISLSFITSTNTRAYYYIALYDMTDDPIDPTFKSMTQSQDNNQADSKTFNVKKGRKYRLTFSKLNPKNDDWIRGKGSIQGISL